MALDRVDIVILLCVTVPFLSLCFVCLCGFYCKNRKAEPRQNNSSSQHESLHPTEHPTSSASFHGYTRNHSSPSPAVRIPGMLTASSFRTFRNARHDTESVLTTPHDSSDGYVTPKIPTYTEDPPKDLFTGNSFHHNKALPEPVPRIPSSAKPYSKSSTRVHPPSHSRARGELPPQPPTPGCLPPQPPTPGCLPPQPPTPGCLPPQPPTPGYLPPQPPTPVCLPPLPPTPGCLPPQPPTPGCLPPQPPTPLKIPLQPPSTDEPIVRVYSTSPCSMSLKPQSSLAEELPIPPSTQPPKCPEKGEMTNEEGTAEIRIVFPCDQGTLRNPSQTPLWQRPVTLAFLDINKLIKIKVKTNR